MPKSKRRLILISLIFAIIVGAIIFWDYKANHQYIYRNLVLSETDFLLPGYELFVGIEEKYLGRCPSQPYQKLYLSDKKAILRGTRVVGSPRDLYRRVHIDSSAKALSYVRLFTSPLGPMRGLLPGDIWGEVAPQSALDKQFFFGDEDWLKASRNLSVFKGTQLSPEGILTDEEFKQNGFPNAQVKRHKSHFIVNRVLFKIPENEYKTTIVYWVEERVSRKGKIKRSIIKRLENKDCLEFCVLKILE